MSEFASQEGQEDNPFRFLISSVQEALNECKGAPDTDTRQLPNFGSITLSRNLARSACAIENLLPVDDDGFHRVFTFMFDEKPRLIMGIKHCTHLDQPPRVVGEVPIIEDSYWEDIAHQTFKKYLQAGK